MAAYSLGLMVQRQRNPIVVDEAISCRLCGVSREPRQLFANIHGEPQLHRRGSKLIVRDLVKAIEYAQCIQAQFHLLRFREDFEPELVTTEAPLGNRQPCKVSTKVARTEAWAET